MEIDNSKQNKMYCHEVLLFEINHKNLFHNLLISGDAPVF